MSEAVTEGIRIKVQSKYLPQQSTPENGRFVFAYTVKITNESQQKVQLRTRHWVIADASNKIEEVRGEGVVGKKPILAPNESFEYTSGCSLKTPWGTMHGTYRMHRGDGSSFDAEIAPFLLATPSVEPSGAPN